MAFLKAFDISGSALTAQRLRLEIISENISNIDTTRVANGDGPYRRQVVQFQEKANPGFRTALLAAVDRDRTARAARDPREPRDPWERRLPRDAREDPRELIRERTRGPRDGGVIVSAILQDETPFRLVYDPVHPDADEFGYVQMPNVDLLKETVDAMSASRSYEANVTALNSIKAMATKALEIGR